MVVNALNIPELPEKKSPRKKKPAVKRPQPTALAKELRTIYSGPDGKLPDFSRLQIRREHRARKVLIVLVLFFGIMTAAAWAGILVFKPFGKFQGPGVVFSFEAPAELSAGAETAVVIEYENRERVPLGNVRIMVGAPAGFEIIRSEPAPTEGRRWSVGNLKPRESGKITITGRVLAPLGAEIALQTFATYVPGNFNSEFQSVGAYRARVASSVLALEPAAPESVSQGEEFEVAVSVKNIGEAPLDALEVRAAFPEQFLPKTSGPAVWKIPILAPGSVSSVAFRGAFSSDASGEKNFNITVGRLVRDEPFALFSAATSTVRVLGGELRAALLVNGSAEPQPLNFGDTLRASLVYENQGTEALKDVSLALVVAAAPRQGETNAVDWSTLEVSSNGVRDGDRVRWTRRQVGDLRILAPGAEGTLDVTVDLRGQPFTLDNRDYHVSLWIESTVGSIGSKRVDRTVQSSALLFPINSDSSITGSARYYNDDEVAVGTGPLPPKVGETTTFKIFWKVSNSLHELMNLKMSAVLPAGVNWTNRSNVSAGSVEYRPETRAVTWTLNRMPETVPEITADFEISVIPSAEQAGKVLPLLERATLDADDAAAGSHLTRSAPALDSTLEGDPVAAGRGTVAQ